MTMLAHDQDEASAAALVSELQVQAAQIPYTTLQDTIRKTSDNLRSLEARRLAAFEAMDAAKAALVEQEGRLAVEHGGSYPRTYLRQWLDALDRASAKSANLRGEEERLRQLAGVLTEELAKRDGMRAQAVKNALRERYAPIVDAKVAAARAAVIEALCAVAWASGSMAPDQIDPSRFSAEVLRDDIIGDGVRAYVQVQQADVQKQIQQDDKRLG
jgi:hypothetical protein